MRPNVYEKARTFRPLLKPLQRCAFNPHVIVQMNKSLRVPGGAQTVKLLALSTSVNRPAKNSVSSRGVSTNIDKGWDWPLFHNAH